MQRLRLWGAFWRSRIVFPFPLSASPTLPIPHSLTCPSHTAAYATTLSCQPHLFSRDSWSSGSGGISVFFTAAGNTARSLCHARALARPCGPSAPSTRSWEATESLKRANGLPCGSQGPLVGSSPHAARATSAK